MSSVSETAITKIRFRVDKIPYLSGIKDGQCNILFSCWVETEDPVQKIPYIIESGSTRYEMAEITIDIYHKGNFPHWELTSLYPANLVSGSFVRSFISQGMLYHQQLLPGQEIKLLLNDNSGKEKLRYIAAYEFLNLSFFVCI